MKMRCPYAPARALDLIRARAGTIRGEIDRVQAADPSGIHDMRVASRRMRAALGEHTGVFPRSVYAPLLQRARRITKSLGACRELDVSLELLDETKFPVPGTALAARDQVREHLLSLRAQASSQIDDAIEAAASPELDSELDALANNARNLKRCYLEHMSNRLVSAHGKLAQQYKTWRKSGCEEELHELRIRFKKLRYTCELYIDVYGDDLKKFAKELKKAQDSLGTWNDYRVLRNYVQAFCENPETPVLNGMHDFQAELDARIMHLLHKFERKAQGFFDKEKRRRTEALFRWPQSPCCLVRLEDVPMQGQEASDSKQVVAEEPAKAAANTK